VEQLELAQLVTIYVIGGREMQRIRYGEEPDDWAAHRGPCHDCGAIKGRFHVGPACDVERCPSCGGQVISCECEYEGDETRGFPRGT
jgi:rRNA maturation endonuclease Nob1